MSGPPPEPTPYSPATKLGEVILDFLGQVPESEQNTSLTPATSARKVARAAAQKAARTAGTLALPPGPLGWLTLVPELVAVWKIQAKMVSDIAAIYGRKTWLSREQMIYCLFRHAAAQAVRDLVIRVGGRFLVKRASRDAMRGIARKIGLRLSQRALGKGAARWVPVLGAVGVGAYAYYDTVQVAHTAIELFESGGMTDEDAPALEN